MLYYALMFLVVGLMAGVLGATGVAAIASQIAWILFIIGIVLLAMDFVLIGILVACGAIPAALVAWMTAGDRV